MFGRKRRIKELEEQLHEALHNLVNVTLELPPGMKQVIGGLPKGQWYNVSFYYRVSDNNTIDTASEQITQTQQLYFDGGSDEGPVFLADDKVIS